MPITWSDYPNAFPRPLSGRIERHTFDSELLAGNPLGDPAQRPLEVYVPPGYDDDPDRRYPSVYVIQGYTGTVQMWHNRAPFRATFPEAVDAMFADGGAPPCVLVFVDAWTAYGGSQFVDSPGTGRYHSYLCDEVVPFVDARYRTLTAAAHRGITGKSSGGFGAMITPMLRPDLFGGLASHAGDALYELCYIHGFGDVVRALRDYEGSYERFWEDFASRPPMSKDTDPNLVMTYGVAAAFSADPDGTVHPATGWTDLVLGPDRPPRVVDGLITGWHDPQASHLLLVEAVAGPALTQRAYDAAVAGGYLWHEFGDSALLLP